MTEEVWPMRVYLAAAGVLALAACHPAETESPMPDRPIPCIAPDLQSVVGQPRSALNVAELPDPKRIIGPDTAVTMDYRPERLNLQHDARGTIIRIFCG